MKVTQGRTRASIVLSALVTLICAGCAPEPTSKTLKGPESTKLVDPIHGYVIAHDESEMYALSLPKLRRQKLVSRADFPTSAVHSVSGPDADGVVVYVEDEMTGAKKHRLRKVSLEDDKNQVIFERSGSALWDSEIGNDLALAPVGGRVALLEHLQDKQMPQALLETGRLVLVDLADGSQKTLHERVLDEPMSWFPDGVRLAYARMTPRNSLNPGTLGIEEFGWYFGEQWNELPAIYILDTATGQEEFLCLGWDPYVDAHGTTVLVGGWGKNGRLYTIVDLATKTMEAVEPPGISAAVVGRPTEDLLIYGALPTEGAKIEMMKSYSPLRGPRPLVTIKLADLTTGEFQTLVPYVDPRHPMSFGRTAAQRDVGKE